MPRKGPAPRREMHPDPVYRSLLVTQLMNKVMLSGKKSVAEKIVYDALKMVEEKTGAEPIATLKRAIDNGGRTLSMAPPIRCPSKSSRVARTPWPFAGSSITPALVAKRPWLSASPTNCSTPAMASALP